MLDPGQPVPDLGLSPLHHMLSPKALRGRGGGRPDEPQLPPALWHPLAVSQSILTNLLNRSTRRADSQAIVGR